jgi:hypothetical protein
MVYLMPVFSVPKRFSGTSLLQFYWYNEKFDDHLNGMHSFRFLFAHFCPPPAQEGLLLMDDPLRLEQTAVPTALCWHPLLGEGDKKDFEDRFVTANSE